MAGGNLVDYPGNVSTPTTDMLTAKLLFNSVLSTLKAKFSCFNISNFYLNTPMERYEYICIPTWAIPKQVMTEYKLHNLIRKDHVLVEIHKSPKHEAVSVAISI
jgi:hypothetical protein